MKKQITVGDLKDQIGKPGPHPILYCSGCAGEFSANRGDYFQLPDNKVLECCGRPMQLVFKRTMFEPAK